jgi:hypothetical protein
VFRIEILYVSVADEGKADGDDIRSRVLESWTVP